MKYLCFALCMCLYALLQIEVRAQDASSNLKAPSTPTVLAPGVISTTQSEFSPMLDMNRQTLYFMRRTPGVFDYTIYASTYDNEGWTTPVVASFSGTYRDDAPYLSPDGTRMFFDSDRPAAGLPDKSINLWYTDLQDGEWTTPQLLDTPSRNKPASSSAGEDEFGPAIDANGVLYFYSFRPPFRGGARYEAQPPNYDEIKRSTALPDPSAQTFVGYLYLSPDGKTAILEGWGKERDLFYACRQLDGTWSEAQQLPLVNTDGIESNGWLSDDGQILIYSSTMPVAEAQARNSNIFWMSTDTLPIPCR